MKRFRLRKKSIFRAIRTFSLCIGVTSVTMLAVSGILGTEGLTGGFSFALPASAFHGSGKTSPALKTDAAGSQPNGVIPVGAAFGIKLFTDGVIVASLSDVYTQDGLCCPAQKAGIKPGDYLLEANGVSLKNNRALIKVIGKSEGKEIAFKVRRGDRVFEAAITPEFSEGALRTGMWVRDSAAGIGTITFYDPASDLFAGLGHGICDMDTSGIMALKSGEPAEITLCGIKKGEAHSPGQLKGYFSSDESMGTLFANNETGVYGALKEKPEGRAVGVIPKKEVEKGPVKLLVSLDETGPQLYDAEIQKIGPVSENTRNLVLKVTDPRLLELTGGIVQGMSGAPILQGGRLAGAVTHVFTEDPTMGYGIFAQTMLEQCRQISAINAGESSLDLAA